jgi:hypothetical protein
MPSSEMLRRVVLVITDVSEERSLSIIRVTIIGELGKTFGEYIFAACVGCYLLLTFFLFNRFL